MGKDIDVISGVLEVPKLFKDVQWLLLLFADIIYCVSNEWGNIGWIVYKMCNNKVSGTVQSNQGRIQALKCHLKLCKKIQTKHQFKNVLFFSESEAFDTIKILKQ